MGSVRTARGRQPISGIDKHRGDVICGVESSDSIPPGDTEVEGGRGARANNGSVAPRNESRDGEAAAAIAGDHEATRRFAASGIDKNRAPIRCEDEARR